VNSRFELVRVTVGSFREGMRSVNLDVHDIIPLWHTGDVDPLAAELFEIPIGPASGNSLERTGVTAALVIVRILDQVLETERLLMSHRRNRSVLVQQLVIGKSGNVIMIVTRRENEDRVIRIIRIGRTADHQVAIAAV